AEGGARFEHLVEQLPARPGHRVQPRALIVAGRGGHHVHLHPVLPGDAAGELLDPLDVRRAQRDLHQLGLTRIAQHPGDGRAGDGEAARDRLHRLPLLVVHPCSREESLEAGFAGHAHHPCTFVHRACGLLHVDPRMATSPPGRGESGRSTPSRPRGQDSQASMRRSSPCPNSSGPHSPPPAVRSTSRASAPPPPGRRWTCSWSAAGSTAPVPRSTPPPAVCPSASSRPTTGPRAPPRAPPSSCTAACATCRCSTSSSSPRRCASATCCSSTPPRTW